MNLGSAIPRWFKIGLKLPFRASIRHSKRVLAPALTPPRHPHAQSPLDTSNGNSARTPQKLLPSIIMKTALCILVASFCGVTASAIQPGMIDLSFNSGGEGTFEEVHSLAVQPDGKILIGGDFTEFNGVSRNRLARLLVNGKLDPAFDQVGTGANATVHAMAVLPNQHTLIAGAFTNYGGLNRGRMARIDEFGLPDTAFSGVGADGTVHALMVLPSGQVLVAGAFTSLEPIR
jgi:hypothetical protein